LGQSAPVSPDESGENTTERVALRCLEEPIVPENGVSFSNLKKAGPELLRWDVQPFIMHKKALLPKCSLEQLKGDIKKFDCLHGDKQMEDESGITIKVTKIDGCHLGHDSQAGEGEEDVNVATRTFERPCKDQLCENEDERLNIAMKRSLKFAEQTNDSAVAVHRSCLGSSARYDDKGNFLCPFCACSLSNSKYLEGKDRIILARKNVVALVELC
ncbi:hypothetical protein Godav_006244, partial [Gossypium davidsonii]|nr:hypothetical protein [Gossypium davidsonii]